DPGFLSLRRLQEAAGRAGDIDVAHTARDHRGDEEILLEEIGQRRADAVLVPGYDRRVGDGQAERMAEESRDGEPVGEAANHGRFGERLHISQAWPGRLIGAGREEYGRPDQ